MYLKKKPNTIIDTPNKLPVRKQACHKKEIVLCEVHWLPESEELSQHDTNHAKSKGKFVDKLNLTSLKTM